MASPDISLLGATYSGVTGVTLPKSGGGTATFPWVEGSATKTQNGTYDVTNLAELIVNVSGGGGSGLVYESGTYSPSADASQPTISFSNQHTDRPFAVLIVDATGTVGSASSISAFYYFCWYDAFGTTFKQYSGGNTLYARAMYTYWTSNNTSFSSNSLTSTGSSTKAGIEYWVTNTNFRPYTNSSSNYFRSGRTYKWIAVWKP